jgi:DNA-binding XRE family transcriptional regulator
MTVKAIAKLFKLRVDDFSKEFGYSRQSIHCILNGKYPNSNRPKAMIATLKLKSDKIYQGDVVYARFEKLEREKAIEELQNIIERVRG